MSRRPGQKPKETLRGKPFAGRRRIRWAWGIGCAAAVVAGAVVAVLLYTQHVSSGVESASQRRIEIPNPDTSEMQPRVARQISQAREALMKEPDSAIRWGAFGAVCDAYMLYGHAATCYRRASELAPDDFSWPYLLAVVMRMQGASPPEVVALLERVVKQMPEFPPAYVRLGQALIEQGKPKAAGTAFLRAVELRPDLAIAHNGLGQVQLALNDAAAAIPHLELATKLAPNDGPTLAMLAQAHRRMGNTKEAAQLAERARPLGPMLPFPDPLRNSIRNLCLDSGAVFQRALHFMNARNYTSAIEQLRMFEEAKPRTPYVQMLLAIAHLKSAQPQQAEKHFARALKFKKAQAHHDSDVSPRSQQLAELDDLIVFYWAEYLAHVIATGDVDKLQEVVADLEHAAQALPLDARVHVEWGRARRVLGDLSGAAEQNQRAIQIDPDCANAYFNLGIVSEERNEVDAAIRYYSRAVEIDPKGPAAKRVASLLTVVPEK